MIAVDTAATRGCGERQQLFVCFEDLGVNDSLDFSRLPQHHTHDASKRVVRGDPLGGRGGKGRGCWRSASHAFVLSLCLGNDAIMQYTTRINCLN